MKKRSKIRQFGSLLFGQKKLEGAKRYVRSQRIVGQTKMGRSLDHGFLHIPKTGGAAFSEFNREMVKAGYVMPVKFGHAWSLSSIIERFPDTKVSFMIRDPLERTISAFNSRLRQGRPRFANNWSVGEAAAFSFFPDVCSFLDALTSEDEYDISAVNFAQRNIKHLQWNYQNYFEGVKNIDQLRASIHLVGEVENSIQFWKKLSAQFDIPSEVVAKNFKREHVAKITSQDIIKKFSEEQIEAMKLALKTDYKIYYALKELVNC